MGKAYEFWCRDCGEHSYKPFPNLTYCSKDGSVLELTATVDALEHLEGVMGMQIPYTNRKIIDKRPRK
jgi:hypothetical protein